MRVIRKQQEPGKLKNYRKKPGATYDGQDFAPVKKEIRDALLTEQGHLCAYCQQRISSSAMKIEHWRSQSQHSTEQLSYANMLGCCNGNEGEPQKDQHCDTRKGEDDILYNPANLGDRDRLKIRYFGDGKITSDDVLFNDQLTEILNLNWWRLKNNRKKVLDALNESLARRQGSRSKAEITRLMKSKSTPDSQGKFPEYVGVIEYFLGKKLKIASQNIVIPKKKH